jgi:hypothetical protein
LEIWAQLVKKVNPDVYTASKAVEAWLGPYSIRGGSSNKKQTLSIETDTTTDIYDYYAVMLANFA